MRQYKYFQRRFEKFKHKSKLRQIFKWFLVIGFSVMMFGILTGVGIAVYFAKDLPSAEEIKNINFTQSTVILDREGNPLYTIHGEENRELITLDQISENMTKATLAVEDHEFYKHPGFQFTRIVKAFYNNARNKLSGRGGRTEGASTITQQLVKNTFLSPEKTYTRKIKELLLSIMVEYHFSKDEILEMYLNKIPYGNNAYGIKRAAQIYFNVEPKDLTLAQSALLASLPQAPSRYNPYGDHKHTYLLKEFTEEELKKRPIKREADLELSEFSRGLIGKTINLGGDSDVYISGRSDIVLTMMENFQFITPAQKREALEGIQNTEFEAYRELMKAPHFVQHVKKLLENKYGKEMVEQGGLRVYTTLDPALQETAEKIVAEKASENLKLYGAENAALLSVQPQTGQILAMVGSADYYNKEISGNVNIVTRRLQPGSSFKSFLYAQAFLKRYAPANIIYDVPTKFGPDEPQNFDGKFEGPITLRRALAYSRNIPAIKIYYLAGEQKAILPFVKELGIDSLDPEFDYGWPLSLGTGEVTMMEMVQAYSVFANSGVKKTITPILKIEDSTGKILEQWDPNDTGEKVLDPQVAYLINNILSDPELNFGRQVRVAGHTVAAKTGTSNKKINDKILPANAWVFGYSPKILTAVWGGNSDGTALNATASGYYIAGPIWNQYMTEALKDKPDEPFPVPEGIQQYSVSMATGKLPGELTPEDMIRTDYFTSFSKPVDVEDVFKQATVDKLTGKLANPYTPEHLLETKLFRNYLPIDPTRTDWQAYIDKWMAAYPGAYAPLPTAADDLHTAETAKATPTIQITNPLAFDHIATGFTPVTIKIDAPHGVDKVEYYFDSMLQYTSKDSPYNGSIRIFGTKQSEHSIEVKVYDSLQYISSTKITVYLGDSTTTVNSPPTEDKTEIEPAEES